MRINPHFGGLQNRKMQGNSEEMREMKERIVVLYIDDVIEHGEDKGKN